MAYNGKKTLFNHGFIHPNEKMDATTRAQATALLEKAGLTNEIPPSFLSVL